MVRRCTLSPYLIKLVIGSYAHDKSYKIMANNLNLIEVQL